MRTLLLVFLAACGPKASTETPPEPPSEAAAEEPGGDDAADDPAEDEARVVARQVEGEWEISPVRGTFEGGAAVETVEVITVGGTPVLLARSGPADGACRTLGTPLVEGSEGYTFASGVTTHQCRGVDCTRCDLRVEEGELAGCTCATPAEGDAADPRCDHDITTEDPFELWKAKGL